MWYAECLKNCYNTVDRTFYDAIKIIYPLPAAHSIKRACGRALRFQIKTGECHDSWHPPVFFVPTPSIKCNL